MAFVQAVPGKGEAIATAILAMARAFGLTVLAEGVETAAQRDFFRSAGCPQLQGYFSCLPARSPPCGWIRVQGNATAVPPSTIPAPAAVPV